MVEEYGVCTGLAAWFCQLDCYHDFSDSSGSVMPSAIQQLIDSSDLQLLVERTSYCAAQARAGCCAAGYVPFNQQYCRPQNCLPCFCDGRHLHVSDCCFLSLTTPCRCVIRRDVFKQCNHAICSLERAAPTPPK